MEPMNATARYTADKCEVWVPTQDGEAAFAAVLAASGLPADKCEVYKINLGGGFGRRGAFQDYVHQAVLIAKQMPGTPVKLLWSREEDMVQGRYHPVMQCKLVGALRQGQQPDRPAHAPVGPVDPRRACARRSSSRRRAATRSRSRACSRRGEHSFGYTIPNLLIDHAMRNPHVPPGFWRGVNINQNAIFIECFMDELAQAAGQDALEFRRKLMGKHPRNLAVLNAVAERDRLGQAGAAGRLSRARAHEGVRQLRGGGGGDLGRPAATRSRCTASSRATDPGYAVNPAQIERQVAGSFVYGLSALFYAGVHGQGRAHRARPTSTPTTRCASPQMPKVESIIMPTGGNGPGAASASRRSAWRRRRCSTRIFKATGKRIRSFPLKNHGIELV